MKKHVKILLGGLVVLCMMGVLAACGGEEAAQNPLTEEEYEQAVTDLGETFSSMMLQSSEAASEPEKAIPLLEELKTSLNEFIAIVPPEAYAEGHAKLQAGSQAAIEYVDMVIEFMNDPDYENLEELQTKMLEKINESTVNIEEGSRLLEEAMLK